MPLATPRWFDADYFAEQKIEQMNLIKWQGKSDWDNASYLANLNERNMTPYEDFVASNAASSLEFTNFSPNPLFNVQEYLIALANFANKSGYSYAGYPAGQWTAQKAMEHMFNDYHVSAWDHFTLAGQFDLVNPSNALDIASYYASLTYYRNSYVNPNTGVPGWEGRTNWTLQEVVNDNILAEINPVEGLYGEAGTAGIIPAAVPLQEQVIINNNWNPWITIPATPTTPDTPTTPPAPANPGGGSGGNGGSNTPSSPSNPSNPSTPTPDTETITIAGDVADTYIGKNNVATTFEAPNGVNVGDIIDGGRIARIP